MKNDKRSPRRGGGSRPKPERPRSRPAARPRAKSAAPDRAKRLTIPIVSFLLVVLLTVVGWSWKSQLHVRDVVVIGARHTPVDSLIAIAAVDSGAVFFDIDTHAIADRIARLPWIEEARVYRGADMTIKIDVHERTPALMAVDASGKPTRFIDAGGYQMPYVRGHGYDVPLLKGLKEPFIAGAPTENPALLELADVVSRVDETTDALLSEFELADDGGVLLYTTPKPGRGAIQVGMGTGGFERKLSRLQAFWDQEVLAQREKHFEWIDLRFDSQIITRERTLTQ
ncbi:MAG: FtsQ-type POTRA domain-containing protein [Rhodothermales bacterium]